MQSRLMTLPMLTTRQQCLFLWVTFFRRMCMRICYVHFCCQGTPQFHNYSSLWMITYSRKLNWSFCVGICVTEQLPWLDGFLVSLLGSKVASECESTHCVIHREMLASWKMSPELNNVLQDVIKIINHIKVHALNSRLFAQLCEEMDTEHTRLLLYTEVRWLSKGRSLARVFKLWEPLQKFLLEKQSPLAAHFSDTEWVAKLAYLCDIFKPAQRTQSVTSGGNNSSVHVSI